jgi:hypothetical protein
MTDPFLDDSEWRDEHANDALGSDASGDAQEDDE